MALLFTESSIAQDIEDLTKLLAIDGITPQNHGALGRLWALKKGLQTEGRGNVTFKVLTRIRPPARPLDKKRPCSAWVQERGDTCGKASLEGTDLCCRHTDEDERPPVMKKGRKNLESVAPPTSPKAPPTIPTTATPPTQDAESPVSGTMASESEEDVKEGGEPEAMDLTASMGNLPAPEVGDVGGDVGDQIEELGATTATESVNDQNLKAQASVRKCLNRAIKEAGVESLRDVNNHQLQERCIQRIRTYFNKEGGVTFEGSSKKEVIVEWRSWPNGWRNHIESKGQLFDDWPLMIHNYAQFLGTQR